MSRIEFTFSVTIVFTLSLDARAKKKARRSQLPLRRGKKNFFTEMQVVGGNLSRGLFVCGAKADKMSHVMFHEIIFS